MREPPLALPYATAGELARALGAGELSALEALEATLERIAARDGDLNSIVVRDFERARRAARAADEALARGERRALLGVPMTVKEAFNVSGLPTSWGLVGARETYPGQDAVAVRRLKAGGAVIIGKTNVPTHLGDWQCTNALYGRTRNPWGLDRTPGGSSGGSAAALAAGLVPLELGSDLAGSLRVPAHCCGVYAHKPTLGLVPSRGHAPPGAPELDIDPEPDLGVVGPMARSADDLALALEVLAGPDAPHAIACRLALPPARHARLGEFKALLLDEHPLVPLAAEVRAAIRRFADRLADTGCAVERSSPMLPDLALIDETFGLLLLAFIGANLPDAAYEARRQSAGSAAAPGTGSDPIRQRALVASHRDWLRARRTRTLLQHQWRALFRSWDVVICPVLPVTAFEHDDREVDQRRIVIDGRPYPYAALGVWAGPATLCGLPATAMPVGHDARGMPIGVQVIGPYLEDLTTVAFAQLAEREFGGFRAPPGYGPDR
jgi:amidase